MKRKRLFFWVFTGLSAAGLFLMVSCESQPPDNSRASQAMRGKEIFLEKCAVCHGLDGKTPIKDTLEMIPADLTKIMANRKAPEFPVAEIARIIDGRREVAGHGDRDMPVWGEVFKSEGLDENQLKGRLGELIAYLMSIQEASEF